LCTYAFLTKYPVTNGRISYSHTQKMKFYFNSFQRIGEEHRLINNVKLRSIFLRNLPHKFSEPQFSLNVLNYILIIFFNMNIMRIVYGANHISCNKPQMYTLNPFRSYVGPRPTLWFSCSRRFSWSLTLPNPFFLPPAYSPPLIYFGRERGWWVNCNFPTVLKEKHRNRKSTTCAICWLKSVLHEEKRREQENNNVGLRSLYSFSFRFSLLKL
jgi:hypothetical protein